MTNKSPYQQLYGTLTKEIIVDIPKPQNMKEYEQLLDVCIHLVGKLQTQIDGIYCSVEIS